jgi:hypothetical protein
MTDLGFPHVPMGGTLPPHLLITASRNGRGIEVGLTCNVRVCGLQVVETDMDLPVRAHGAARLVISGSTINGCFPQVPVGGTFPRELCIAASHNGCRVKICFPSKVRMRRLQIIEMNKNI